MPRMEFEREFEYKTYKTKKEISDHKDLLASIIAFVQAYRCIFPNASNPRIEIRVHSSETGENFLYEIDTKYQRRIISSIEWDYAWILRKNEIVKNLNNISGVVFFSKGTHAKYREYTIFSNGDIPWDYHNFIKVDWKKIRRRNDKKK